LRNWTEPSMSVDTPKHLLPLYQLVESPSNNIWRTEYVRFQSYWMLWFVNQDN